MDLNIRKAEERDVSEVNSLLNQLIKLDDNYNNLEFLSEKIKSLYEDPNYYLAVACKEGHVIGMGMGILCQNIYKPLSPFMVVEDMIVKPAYRNQGIGRRIMFYLENWAVKNDCGFICMVSQHKRKEAHRFYETIGYEHDDGFQKFLSR